jgi:hypothetical protein
MPYKLNFSTGELDYYDSSFKGVLATAPSDPAEGWTYINSVDNGYYLYYGLDWQLLHTLVPAAMVGVTNEDGTQVTNEDGTDVQREP